MAEAPSSLANLPLAGLRVLDLAQGFAGPYCAAMLGAQGAHVTKVEPPGGDWIRTIGGAVGDMTAWTIVANANKRSLCLDAKLPEGRRVLRRLAESADVVVHNYRPGVAERLGVGYDDLARVHPRVIYVAVTGFGPRSERAGSDSVFQAFTGLANQNMDEAGMPRRVPVLLPDTATGIYAANAVAIALYARERTGQGRHLQVSMLQSCAALQASSILDACLFGADERPPSTVPSGIFATRDGFMTVTCMSDGMFKRLVTAAGLPELAEDPRLFAIAGRQRHADEINAAVAQRLQLDTTAHWLGKFGSQDVLCSEVLDYRRFRDSAESRDDQAFVDLHQSGVGDVPMARIPCAAGMESLVPCPHVGEHTEHVLQELQIPESEIRALLKGGAAVQWVGEGRSHE
jgi:crotonobetainyl-CoA:carnitine CoA-transferase CaiB-like acyl-CoA transferase